MKAFEIEGTNVYFNRISLISFNRPFYYLLNNYIKEIYSDKVLIPNSSILQYVKPTKKIKRTPSKK